MLFLLFLTGMHCIVRITSQRTDLGQIQKSNTLTVFESISESYLDFTSR